MDECVTCKSTIKRPKQQKRKRIQHACKTKKNGQNIFKIFKDNDDDVCNKDCKFVICHREKKKKKNQHLS